MEAGSETAKSFAFDDINEETVFDGHFMNETVDGMQDIMQLGQGSPTAIEDPRQEVLRANHLQRKPARAQMKSAVLLVSSFWHSKYHARKVNKLLEKSSTQEAMYEDMDRESKMLSMCKVQKHRTTDRRTRGEAQAQALYQLLEDLDSSGITPEFVVR